MYFITFENGCLICFGFIEYILELAEISKNMNRLPIYLILLFFASCDKTYEKISDQYFQALSVQDTLLNNKKILVLKVGDSISDTYPRLLVKSNQSKTKNYYLFKDDCELENDSIILSYYPAFIYDEDGEFRKNGIWVYTEFYSEGTFPFTSKVMRFSVDSIPKDWNKALPAKEGIYFYKNNSLSLITTEQSEDKFKEKEMDGFYFIPNKGRLFDKININQFE